MFWTQSSRSDILQKILLFKRNALIEFFLSQTYIIKLSSLIAFTESIIILVMHLLDRDADLNRTYAPHISTLLDLLQKARSLVEYVYWNWTV